MTNLLNSQGGPIDLIYFDGAGEDWPAETALRMV